MFALWIDDKEAAVAYESELIHFSLWHDAAAQGFHGIQKQAGDAGHGEFAHENLKMALKKTHPSWQGWAAQAGTPDW
jgi:hypothetical protein